jgi:alpha-L-rhamnosidase
MGGIVPIFAPVPKGPGRVPWFKEYQGSSIWGDVGSHLPWSLYMHFGDLALLKRHWPIIRDWADWITGHSLEPGYDNLWMIGKHFGDWLALDTGMPQYPQGATDEWYIASAFYFQTLTIAAKTAAVLGLDDEQRRFADQAERTKSAFLALFWNAEGVLQTTETQTALVVALSFGLYPEGLAPRLVQMLVKRIEDNDCHLDTGFVGTFLLPRVLSTNGANETAYSLLLQESYPSWLYEVAMGATTIWERWNGVLPTGVVNSVGMNSLNHYAYGSIASWMYRVMCGLNPVEEGVGYKRALIKPMPDPRVNQVKMVRDTAAGRYEIEWQYRETVWHVRVVVPFDCEATVALPGRDEEVVPAGEYAWDLPI